MRTNEREKCAEAHKILQSCMGPKGVLASTSRYDGQYWTRDLALAVAPLLHQLGRSDVVRTHLEHLSSLQRPNGQIPILFLEDEEAWVAKKECLIREQSRDSFMLHRYREGGLWNLTPGTKDSEILYILAFAQYAHEADSDQKRWKFLRDHRQNIQKALDYINQYLMHDGLVIGCDWRDTMEKKLCDTALLSNNVLFYQALQLIGEHDQAQRLRVKIQQHFFQNGIWIDHRENNCFDPLGGALAILYDVADPDTYPSLIRSFTEIDSPYGVTAKCRHNPSEKPGEAEVIERTDGVVVWPFIEGFTILSLLETGNIELALLHYDKFLGHAGFPEFIDPSDGKGWGATDQLWSAALFLRVMLAVVKKIR